ncbi:sensor histidine kinase [Actinoplanes friuliensis]|nr:ATP-binding protein [Actinoplanes friuliensis]
MRLLRRETPPDPALLVLRSVCHELRPPVATLTSLMRALQDQPSEVRRGELARLAAEHASHAQAVLMQAAAAASGLAGPVDEPAPLHRILHSVAVAVPADRLTVAVSRAAGNWPVPARRTRQILLNLLTNAAAYSPGRIRLQGAVRMRRLRLTVADEGALTADLLRALRRPGPPEGTKGLGLWMVRQLTAAQGGTVRARALSPHGVAVEVQLPRKRRS